MNVVVLYESMTGNTKRAAELIGDAVSRASRERDTGAVQVTVRPVTAFDYGELAEADLVFLGTWTDGLVLFGQRPGRVGRLRRLPVLDRKPVAVFCTYAVNPGGAARKLAALAESRGAVVVGARALHRRRLEVEAEAFAVEVLAELVQQP